MPTRLHATGLHRCCRLRTPLPGQPVSSLTTLPRLAVLSFYYRSRLTVNATLFCTLTRQPGLPLLAVAESLVSACSQRALSPSFRIAIELDLNSSHWLWLRDTGFSLHTACCVCARQGAPQSGRNSVDAWVALAASTASWKYAGHIAVLCLSLWDIVPSPPSSDDPPPPHPSYNQSLPSAIY